MAISFEIPERIIQETQMLKAVAEGVMRPASRHLDEHEHERPWDFINMMWPVMRDQQAKSLEKLNRVDSDQPRHTSPGIGNLRLIMLAEQLAWGDVGQYLCLPSALLAGSAIEAVGTKEQKLRFL